MSTDELADNAQTAIDRLRADIAETERDIAFQQMRLDILSDTLAVLTGAPDSRQRQQRRSVRRVGAPSVVPTSAPLLDPAA
jgi:outer membrane protein TolC